MQQNRRHYTRITFQSGARFECAHEVFEVEIQDLSFKGALIRLPQDAVLGRSEGKCTLSITLGADEATIVMEMRIVRLAGDRVGLLCEHIDLDSMTHLRHLIEFNLGDPGLLGRELSFLRAA